MKSICIITLLLIVHFRVFGQLVITHGGLFSVFSDTKLTLNNIDLINDGDLSLATTAPVSFIGNAESKIGGSQAVRFFKLEIGKTTNHSVVLQRSINVGSSINFTSGFFDLNGFDVDLETTGSLNGENNSSRFIGSNGGRIILTTTLNNPANLNPGNLGLTLTSSQNIGQVTIKRGHQLQVGPGLTSSISRFFEISSQLATNATASLRFNYLDAELNGLDKNSLVFFKTDDNINWNAIGSSSSDPTGNSVEKTGLNPFSRFTLSEAGNPLPVRFISFNVNCDENKVSINWKTVQEQNTDYYIVERSTDGINWSAITQVPTLPTTSAEKNYQFTDNNPLPNEYYRVVGFDLNGKAQYTSLLRSSCSAAGLFNVWPNPVHGNLFISIDANRQSRSSLTLIDGDGRLVKNKTVVISKGNNQLYLDMSSLAKGVYHLSVQFGDGRATKTMEIIKD